MYTTKSKQILADLVTPVGLFLKLRDYYPEILLLESTDYSSQAESKSFLCFDSLATLTYNSEHVFWINNHTKETHDLSHLSPVESIEWIHKNLNFNSETAYDQYNGLFGFTSFDAVQYFENISFRSEKTNEYIPLLRYDLYRFIIVFDHYFDTLICIENVPDGEKGQIDHILDIFNKQDIQVYPFKTSGKFKSNMSDEQYIQMVLQAKEHCQKGNVFQMVLSRNYSTTFTGDEFNVYRSLRSINPSPFLFYFDYGSFKIFGSSPEAQIILKNREAEIHPIAGTFKRSGDQSEDLKQADLLLKDEKENAEHIMLVDLARNDLSKNCSNVEVVRYKEIQYFSHVIHLTSVVKGKLKPNAFAYQIFADTFPAGTLSGAPKRKALQLIDKLEPTARGFYGGGIGAIFFNGDMTHAIMIRSFISRNQSLLCQAGAGIVINSVPENELQEVNNKLGALKKALNSI